MKLTPRTVLTAYAEGAFPMADGRQEEDVYFVSPDVRCLIPITHIHMPRSLQKSLRQENFSVRFNENFDAVIQACAAPRISDDKTWINFEIEAVFRQLHRLGFAHSVEAYTQDGELAGGLYGLAIGGAFFGESMFHHKTDAAKVALCHLAARLHYAGFSLLDAQFETPHLKKFGTYNVTNATYMRQLRKAITDRITFLGNYHADEMINFLKR